MREEDEHQMAHIPAFRLAPMSEANRWLPKALEEWDRDQPVVVMCHAGIRSNQIAHVGRGLSLREVRLRVKGAHGMGV